MVSISKQAYSDLDNIFIGIFNWDKLQLSIDFVEKYIDEITDECYNLVDLPYHFETKYSTHKPFGSKVHRYRRNNQTTWYIIYDIDNENNIFVNKIISNYSTTD